MKNVLAEQKQSKRGEIVIAIIGLIGVLVTAFLSNLDKIFPKQNVIHATYSKAYVPSGNFETELKYYFNRATSADFMQRQIMTQAKLAAISENPTKAREIEARFDAIEEELPKITNDYVREMLPIFRKHYTLAEIEEVNKFYSTDLMLDMLKKEPLISQDLAPIFVKMLREFEKRIAPPPVSTSKNIENVLDDIPIIELSTREHPKEIGTKVLMDCLRSDNSGGLKNYCGFTIGATWCYSLGDPEWDDVTYRSKLKNWSFLTNTCKNGRNYETPAIPPGGILKLPTHIDIPTSPDGRNRAIVRFVRAVELP